jgi:hypothetical protein
MRHAPLSFTVAAILSAALITPITSFAADPYCNPALLAGAQKAAAEQALRDMKDADDIAKKILDQPVQIADSGGLLSGCVDRNWAVGGFKLPSLAQIIAKAKEQVAHRACSAARQAISPVNAAFGQLNSTIAQYQNQVNALGDNPLGTATGTLGGGNGGWSAVGGQFGGGPGGISVPGGTVSVPGIPGITAPPSGPVPPPHG